VDFPLICNAFHFIIFDTHTHQTDIMSAQQRLISTLPASKTALMESFINRDELAAKILPGVEQTEDIDSSNEARKTRKRRRISRERQAGTSFLWIVITDPNCYRR
jgi:hypothetical protein